MYQLHIPCDHCRAQAKAEIILPSMRSLYLCTHCTNTYFGVYTEHNFDFEVHYFPQQVEA